MQSSYASRAIQGKFCIYSCEEPSTEFLSFISGHWRRSDHCFVHIIGVDAILVSKITHICFIQGNGEKTLQFSESAIRMDIFECLQDILCIMTDSDCSKARSEGNSQD